MKLTRLITSTVGTAMLAGALMLAPQAAEARVFISVGFAPPVIPVYEQPFCPGEGYIWTPGYWAYTDDGYEWVDGAWVVAPYTGALWTPGYWGYGGSGYFWNAGYWGPSVGYYGGINYGFGYFGTGFYGGYWNGGSFFYNREYNRFDRDHDRGFHHVYDRHVDGFDGRPGGSSFARGISNARGSENDRRGGNDRGGTYNSTARNGFAQNGGTGNGNLRIGNGSNMRGAYTNLNQNNGGSFSNNRGGSVPPTYSQPGQTRPGNTFNNGFGGNTRVQPGNPDSGFHPNQGSNARGNFGGNQQAPGPRGNFGGAPAPRGSFGGGQATPAPRGNSGGGAPHGGGGAHPGGHH